MSFLEKNINQALNAHEKGRRNMEYSPDSREVGRVLSLARGVAQVDGLTSVRSEELILLGNGIPGMALDLLPNSIGVALLGSNTGLRSGDEAVASGTVLSVPVGDNLIGRIVDPLGNPLDGGPVPETYETRTVESEAPPITKQIKKQLNSCALFLADSLSLGKSILNMQMVMMVFTM